MVAKNNVVVGTIIVLLIIGILVFIYLRFEDPAIVQYSYSNASVYATYNKQNIETGYRVYINNSIYSKGETLKYGSLLLELPLNQTVSIVNYNLDEQNFYTTELQPTYIKHNAHRFNLKLIKPGKLYATYNEIGDNTIRFTIKNDGEYRHLSYCVKWTLHVLKVTHNESQYTPLIKPQIYNNYDKCYNMNEHLNSNSTILELEYTSFGNFDSRDNIEVVFFDGDKQRGQVLYEQLNDNVYKDIAGENKVVVVPLKN